MLGVQSRKGLNHFGYSTKPSVIFCMALGSVMSNLYKCKDNAMVAIPAKIYSFYE